MSTSDNSGPTTTTTATTGATLPPSSESDVECFYDAEEDDPVGQGDKATTSPIVECDEEDEEDDDDEACAVVDECASHDSDFESTCKQLEDMRLKLTDNNNDDDGKQQQKAADDETPFVPLHQRLNSETATAAAKTTFDDDIDGYVENDGDGVGVEDEQQQKTPEVNDPYFVDESLVAKEDDESSEEQKQTRLDESQELKRVGNDLFKEDKFAEALEHYTRALRTCPLAFAKERAVFFSNRSACHLKMAETAKCIAECTRAIELDATFVKPLLRRAECNQQSDKLEDALADYKKLCELEPKSIAHRHKVYELEEKIKERNEKLKEEMMGKLKELGNMVLKPFGLSTSNFQFVQDPATGSYSVNFNKN